VVTGSFRFHFGLIRGAEERARAADRTLVLGDTRGDPGLEADHLDRLGSVVDGIVIASSRLPDADLRELARLRPVVLHNRELPGLPGVVDGGPAAADAGLASGATALVAYDHLLAIGVLRRLEKRRVPVPATVSVTGFDDVFGADFCHPPLTTVTAPTERAGRALVDVLLDGRAPDAERIVLPVRLRVRGSTGAARTE
jgi:DNA-binding LacI/PurR family transcriptional regulator